MRAVLVCTMKYNRTGGHCGPVQQHLLQLIQPIIVWYTKADSTDIPYDKKQKSALVFYMEP